MDYYPPILDIINETLDTQGIPTNTIAREVGITRKEMIDFRNGDNLNRNLLLDVLNYLYDKSTQELLLIKEITKNWNMDELKWLYENRDYLFETLTYTKKYQFDMIMDDVLRKICVQNSKLILERYNEKDNYLL